MKFIVYFHGYASSPKSDKVSRIRAAVPNSEVYAFPIDIDPEKAEADLSNSIMFALMNNLHSEDEIVFVGTSLGAWWAAKMADAFGVKCVLINPCFDPKNSLIKYGIFNEIRAKYHKMNLDDLDNKVFIMSEVDETIDHTDLRAELDYVEKEYYIFPNTSHRFNGPEFEVVMSGINNC